MQKNIGIKMLLIMVAIVAFLLGSVTFRAGAFDGFGTRFHNVTTPADGATPIVPNEVLNYNMRYNGTTWDLTRGNQQGTALASAARTATVASSDLVNYNSRGIQVVLNVTVASGTGGLQVVVQGKDPVSGTYYKLYAAPTAVTATGIKVYEIYPGSSSAGAGDITVRSAGLVPRTFNVNVLVGDSSSYTYSIGYALIN